MYLYVYVICDAQYLVRLRCASSPASPLSIKPPYELPQDTSHDDKVTTKHNILKEALVTLKLTLFFFCQDKHVD